jgi:hypothetical protein
MLISVSLKDIFAASYGLHCRYSKQITRLNTPDLNLIPIELVSEVLRIG